MSALRSLVTIRIRISKSNAINSVIPIQTDLTMQDTANLLDV